MPLKFPCTCCTAGGLSPGGSRPRSSSASTTASTLAADGGPLSAGHASWHSELKAPFSLAPASTRAAAAAGAPASAAQQSAVRGPLLPAALAWGLSSSPSCPRSRLSTAVRPSSAAASCHWQPASAAFGSSASRLAPAVHSAPKGRGVERASKGGHVRQWRHKSPASGMSNAVMHCQGHQKAALAALSKASRWWPHVPLLSTHPPVAAAAPRTCPNQRRHSRGPVAQRCHVQH